MGGGGGEGGRGGRRGRGFKNAEVVELINLSYFMCFELTSLSKQFRPRSDQGLNCLPLTLHYRQLLQIVK